jgi:hypothetical protein
LESRVEAQKTSFTALHSQLGHLYERLGKDPEKDYCLAYKTGSDNINAFVIKQVKRRKIIYIYELNCFLLA